MRGTWKIWVVIGGLAGCVGGVDGEYVGLGGAVVGAESARMESGPIRGEGLGLDMEGNAERLTIDFTVESEAGAQDVRLTLTGSVLSMLHGSGSGTARLFVDGLTGPEGAPAMVRLEPLGDDRYRVVFTAELDNGPAEGSVVLDFVEGHC